MIGGSGEKKTLRTVARYADMWNAMGHARAHAPTRSTSSAGTATASDATSTRSSSPLGVKLTIRDTRAEAERVWHEAMAHNRTPMADVADDDTFWNGTPEQIADRLRPYVDARLPDGHRRSSRRRTTSRRSSGSIGEVKPLVDAG